MLSELAAVLCADFDGAISETTVSVSLFCRDSSREPTQCDHCIKTPLSLHLNLLLLTYRGQAPLHLAAAVRGIEEGLQRMISSGTEHADLGWASFWESLAGNPAYSHQTSRLCNVFLVPVLVPIYLEGSGQAHRVVAPPEMVFSLS